MFKRLINLLEIICYSKVHYYNNSFICPARLLIASHSLSCQQSCCIVLLNLTSLFCLGSVLFGQKQKRELFRELLLRASCRFHTHCWSLKAAAVLQGEGYLNRAVEDNQIWWHIDCKTQVCFEMFIPEPGPNKIHTIVLLTVNWCVSDKNDRTCGLQ